ncbi:MAG: serine hydroxymethyltransferase [Ignisphaera sp.]|uniref:Serine hydroxymethyltransferase n=1 Tax=Ignisphaera aggregans TaxID=334771 RepID=A0A7C4JJ10_9CREN
MYGEVPSVLLPNLVHQVIDNVKKHNTWRRFETVNLIASENVMSPLAEAVYLCDLMHRYAEGKPRKRYYQGTVYADEIEVLVQNLMSHLFNVEFVEPRAISGTIANAIAFSSAAKPGDKAVVASIQAGAHISHTRSGLLGALGLEPTEIPFDIESWNIDVDVARKIIENVKPKLVVLGASAYLFPHPTKAITEVARSVGATVVHDVAHVLGLIAGGKWPNPVHEGADVATASTHKTFPGPQGGLLLTNSDNMYKAISSNVLKFVSNHHLHRLPALAITAIEMMYFGKAYAEQIVRNARKFAESLAIEGFNVVAEHLGYTGSHIVLVDIRKQCPATKAAKLLEEANIIANKNLLPWDPLNPDNPSGLRFGVQEMTRFGMRESDFRDIAKFVREVLIDKKDLVEVRKKVIEFRKQFLSVQYGFKLREELYSDLLITLRL